MYVDDLFSIVNLLFSGNRKSLSTTPVGLHETAGIRDYLTFVIYYSKCGNTSLLG